MAMCSKDPDASDLQVCNVYRSWQGEAGGTSVGAIVGGAIGGLVGVALFGENELQHFNCCRSASGCLCSVHQSLHATLHCVLRTKIDFKLSPLRFISLFLA